MAGSRRCWKLRGELSKLPLCGMGSSLRLRCRPFLPTFDPRSNDDAKRHRGVALAYAAGLFPLNSILDRIVALCATGEKDQTACKPGSVRPCLRRDLAAIPLGCLLPGTSRDTPGARAENGPCAPPIRSCSGRGLPCRSCRQVRGGLLPHPFTLTSPGGGGLLSVALSLGSRRAGVTRRPVLMEPGLSSSMQARQRPPGHLIRRGL